ncbi:MAG: ATP-binding cassette domain-containing protein [Melioribacteraceae bacterium]|nr:ATP-binding cassette domain-containing protein [Melioribacteraceae bacterium]MCF8432664.1 ATP-binding cassette domain-containing protein [Melioribacteraceae bacterium]
MGKNILKLSNVSKDYIGPLGNKVHLLENIEFDLELNKSTSIIAPKGAGKSSLLKIVSGLEQPTSGEIIASENFKKVLIPSEPSSFPWLSVFENVLFGNKKLDTDKAMEIVELVGLEGYEDHRPHNNSYGFRFRIALARALAVNPDLVVLDEPFTNMKSTTKEEIYSLVREVNSSVDCTFLIGTTNISEAIFLSEQIILVQKNPGKVFDKINIDLPFERSIDIMNDEKFIQIRNQIESKFRKLETNQLFSFSI